MFGRKKTKEERRYYLLPGMGRCRRKRHRQIFWWSIGVAVVFSGAIGYLLYLMWRV